MSRANCIGLIHVLLVASFMGCGDTDISPTRDDRPFDPNQVQTQDLLIAAGDVYLDKGQTAMFRIPKKARRTYLVEVQTKRGNFDLYGHWRSDFEPWSGVLSSTNSGKSLDSIEFEANQTGWYYIILFAREGGYASVGLDESPGCVNACSEYQMSCDLPCNADVPGYECPLLEQDIQQKQGCFEYPKDSGQFEHVGTCYRCDDGQQCCYSGGRDNGSGSFDLAPPLSSRYIPASGEDKGLDDHCACDVVPLCGCMAQHGLVDGCRKCVDGDTFWQNAVFSCNADGPDHQFCENAQAAAARGFDWCANVGSLSTCYLRP